MLKSVRVPASMSAPFERAEEYVDALFSSMVRDPSQGVIRLGVERYVLMRCESLYLTWFDAMSESFGEEAARAFIYNTAREIGRSDSHAFAQRLQLKNGVERLSAGPIHFAHAGWALVEILDDSRPETDDSFFLHYHHPNTFESEVSLAKGRAPAHCVCHFSAGYSAGWTSAAFTIDVHGREIRCMARGDTKCEFIMAPHSRLDDYESELCK